MSLGEIVITTNIEKRSDTSAKPALKMKFKASPGHHMMFLELGTMPYGTTDEGLMKEAKYRMRRIGYIAEDDKEALQKALAALG